MILILFVLFAFFGITVDAQTLPELYDVQGVASDDSLNVREEPNASSGIVEVLGYNRTNVEVLRVDGNWGLIGAGEVSGWVSMSYLSKVSGQDGAMPAELYCYGTEPFWAFSKTDRGLTYNTPGTGARALTVIRQSAAQNGYLIDAQEGPTLSRTLIVSPAMCSDGMSDRTFGMTATLFNEAPDGNSVQTGCCTFQSE